MRHSGSTQPSGFHTLRVASAGRQRPAAAPPLGGGGGGGARARRQRGEIYEEDFETYTSPAKPPAGNPVPAALDPELLPASAAARPGAEARLRELCREYGASSAPSAAADEPTPAAVLPRQSAGSHALQQRASAALGPLFDPVYAYLRGARQSNEDDGAVRHQLLQLVGHERLNDCFLVDQLVFKDLLMSP